MTAATKTKPVIAIEIIEDATGKVIHTVPLKQPASRRYIDKVWDGMSINLDHEKYSLREKTTQKD